jgi:hypothetical protein
MWLEVVTISLAICLGISARSQTNVSRLESQYEKVCWGKHTGGLHNLGELSPDFVFGAKSLDYTHLHNTKATFILECELWLLNKGTISNTSNVPTFKCDVYHVTIDRNLGSITLPSVYVPYVACGKLKF